MKPQEVLDTIFQFSADGLSWSMEIELSLNNILK